MQLSVHTGALWCTVESYLYCSVPVQAQYAVYVYMSAIPVYAHSRVYSETPPYLWTPWGPGEVPSMQRCPHSKGVLKRDSTVRLLKFVYVMCTACKSFLDNTIGE